MLWPTTELSVKGVQSLGNRKKNTIPAKIPARPYIKKFFLRVKLTDIMVDSREHILSKNTRSVIELDKSFITS